jgi:hypothetical protein
LRCLRWTTRVCITLKDGSTRNKVVAHPRGTGERNLTNEDILDKYRSLTSSVISQGRQSAIEKTVLNIESVIDISSLLELLTPSVRPALEWALRPFDLTDQFRQAAGYADRILKGEKPGDLPIQMATKYKLTINFKVAKAQGPRRVAQPLGPGRRGGRIGCVLLRRTLSAFGVRREKAALSSGCKQTFHQDTA